MWIAANQAGKAALALDKALAGSGLQAEQRGEALLDRARAAEAQNDLKTARAKLNEAAATISADPFYWYFSAALAIRENDAVTAKAAIGKALTLEPNSPTILFEAGHVHHFAGDEATARIRSHMRLSVKLKTSKLSSMKGADRRSCSVSPPAQPLPWKRQSSWAARSRSLPCTKRHITMILLRSRHGEPT